MTAPAVRTCPRCSRRRVERLISAGGGLLFKGSGFYITDYRSQGYKDKAKAETDAAKPKAEGESGKGEKTEAGKDGKGGKKEEKKAPEKKKPQPESAKKPVKS